jgi:hypothetical protein
MNSMTLAISPRIDYLQDLALLHSVFCDAPAEYCEQFEVAPADISAWESELAEATREIRYYEEELLLAQKLGDHRRERNVRLILASLIR